MKFISVNPDSFLAPKDYIKLHPISLDLIPSTGLNKYYYRLGAYDKIRQYVADNNVKLSLGGCLKIGNVMHLIVKKEHEDKVTEHDLEVALNNCKNMLLKKGGEINIVSPKLCIREGIGEGRSYKIHQRVFEPLLGCCFICNLQGIR